MQKIYAAGQKISTCLQRIFWPEICPFCRQVNRDGICSECRKKLEELEIREPKCMRCGKPVRRAEQEYCHDCARTHHIYDRGMALWLHKEPVRSSVYQFKYHNQRAFARYYAEEMFRHYGEQIRRWDPQAIIPIPLHPGRQRKRGYNQAELLALELGQLLHLTTAPELLVRIKNTNPQKKQDKQRRKQNLHHAFALNYRLSKQVKRVLIVDDIYTTGNTINEAAKILKQAGVQKVYFLVISIGQGY